jgi:hypothetical protein
MQDSINQMNQKFANQRADMIRQQEERNREARERREAEQERQRAERERRDDERRTEEQRVERERRSEERAEQLREQQRERERLEQDRERQARARAEADRRIEQVKETNDRMERTNRYVPIEVPQSRPAPPASGGYRPLAVPEIVRAEFEDVDFNSCVSFFYDKDSYNWLAIRNGCSEPIHWVNTTNMSGDLGVGSKSSTAETAQEVDAKGNREWAFCRSGYLPVDNNGRFWTGGRYHCKLR